MKNLLLLIFATVLLSMLSVCTKYDSNEIDLNVYAGSRIIDLEVPSTNSFGYFGISPLYNYYKGEESIYIENLGDINLIVKYGQENDITKIATKDIVLDEIIIKPDQKVELPNINLTPANGDALYLIIDGNGVILNKDKLLLQNDGLFHITLFYKGQKEI
ncbi:MAG: hypothetical protein A2V64_05130 [Bacteroidetes bacterium RBG_13_43_22]|nr:MAG: hypothetical protein A2V64_05130 [Bacteroidetes bacterium RBG_13_43_22]